MGVRVLLEVLTAIVCPCIAQLTLSCGRIFLGVTVVVATLLLMAPALGTTDASKAGYKADREHSNDDCAHQRLSVGMPVDGDPDTKAQCQRNQSWAGDRKERGR